MKVSYGRDAIVRIGRVLGRPVRLMSGGRRPSALSLRHAHRALGTLARMSLTVRDFVASYADSVGERANKDSYLKDLCTVLGVPHPSPTTGDDLRDLYVFEKDARFARAGASATTGKIDLYKAGCFILEAKQGSNKSAKKLGTARRETPGWHQAMKDAYGQALGYARAFPTAVPFLVVADLGFCFDESATGPTFSSVRAGPA